MQRTSNNPRMVIRKGSLSENVYLQRDGSWGAYRTAKRFPDQQSAIAFGNRHDPDGSYGLFPCSNQHPIRTAND